ncbi:MAG: protein kinase [Polyangiaceae bacterium]
MLTPAGMRRLGRYALFDEIAAGGMATVHIGRLLGEAGFARTVAIKRLHRHFARAPEFVAMFVDEARLAARIRHPNVVSTLDVVAEGGELFLVMEYVQGESLSRLFRALSAQGEPLPARIAVSIAAGVLYGLHAAHEARSEQGQPLQLVHRDVSPQNVIVDIDGVARVLDFGIAKAASRVHATREGQLKGKLAYMAPEQIMHRVADRRSDIYAVSVVLWEMLTGRRFVNTENVAAAATHIVEAAHEPPSGVTPTLPSELDVIVLRGLSHEPDARFQTAREMAMALEAAVQPHTAREVGEWVQRVAEVALAARAALVAAVENHDLRASLLPAPPPGAPDLAQTESTSVSIVGPVAALRSGARAGLFDPSALQAAEDITSLSATTQGGARAAAPWGLLVAVGGGALAAMILVGLVALRWGAGPATPVAPASGSAAESAASVSPDPPVPPSSTAVSPATPTAIVALPVSALPDASVSAAPISRPSARPTPSAAPSAGPRLPPPVDPCNPSFFIGKDGSKQYKPECI